MVRFLLIAVIAGIATATAAEHDLTYMQRDVDGEFQERTVTLTPSTFLRVGSDGRLRVDTSTAFKTALGIGIADVSGLQSALDARASLAGSYANPSWITALAWSKLTGKPTTLSGYGITDAATFAQGALAVTALQPGANGTNIKIGDGIVVSGAGSSAANGVYSVGGTSGGRTYYQNAAGAQIYWYDTFTPHHWAISHAGTSVYDLYRANVDVPTPDLATGWFRYGGGSDPAPTVASSGVALPTILSQKLDSSALSTWSGSGNLTTVGTLVSGAIPWSLVTGKPTLGTAAATDASAYATAAQGALAASALQAGTAIANVSGLQVALDGTPSRTGNNTFSGNNTFTGNVSLTLATSVTFQRVNIGSSDYGWRYNPASGGQVEFVFPGGTAAFYQTGNPAAPYMYFAGTIQADYLVGAISGLTINSSGLSGELPMAVVSQSLSDTLNSWIGIESQAGPAGLVYAATGPLGMSEPTPVLSYYYPAAYVLDGGTDSINSLTGKYRSPVQLRTDLFPSASASLDFPSIAAAASASLTITVSGALTTNTPTVSLGWSAALPAGIVVSHAWVSASNTVTVTVTNISGAAVDPAAVTCRASVTQY